MRPLLFDVPPLYGTLFMLAAAVWALPEIVGAFFQRSAATATQCDRGSYAAIMGSVGIGLAGAFWSAAWLPRLAITDHRFLVYWLGILLMLAGVALRWVAIFILGRSFTRDVATRGDQTVVQSGPYRAIRHPAYAGTLLTVLGTGLVLSNWAGLFIAMLCSLVGILYRIRVEERALLAALGQPYRDYMRRTHRLIPFTW